MIVEFIDSVTGTPAFVNPAYVVTLRPDPAAPGEVTMVKMKDGETMRVRGELMEVARKLNERIAA